MCDKLNILYHDEHMLAVHKPSGLLVHRSDIDKHEKQFLLQMLRDQIGEHVFPVHRLDKPTSGVILFAKNPDIARDLQACMQSDSAAKHYLLVCRGVCSESGSIDHPLRVLNDFRKKNDKQNKKYRDDKPAQEATTTYRRLNAVELTESVDKYPTSRYSLVTAKILTGRKHQIRRHFKHIAHPIIGCSKYGKAVHNRFFKDRYGVSRLLLHAHRVEISHPVTKQPLNIVADPEGEFQRVLQAFSWQV